MWSQCLQFQQSSCKLTSKMQNNLSNVPPEQVTLPNPFANKNNGLPEQVLVSGNSLVDEFLCSICCNPFTQCVITPCGHHFCKLCVSSWLKQNLSCPFCRNPLIESQLVRNFSMDRMILLFEESVSSSKQLLKQKQDDLVSHLLKPQEEDQEQIIFNETRKQLEDIFRHSIEKSLFKFQTRHKELFNEFQKTRTSIKGRFSSIINQELLKVQDPQSASQMVKKLQFECNSECSKLAAMYKQQIKKLLSTFDEFMNADFEDRAQSVAIQLLPSSSIHPSVSNPSLFQSVSSSLKNEPQKDEPIAGSSPNPPIQHCFTLSYHRMSNTSCSFYLCQECKLNCICVIFLHINKIGICEMCALNCHKNHTVTVFVRNQNIASVKMLRCGCVQKKCCTIQHAHDVQTQQAAPFPCTICKPLQEK